MTATTRPSRVIRRTPLAWDIQVADPERDRSIRIPDFAAFFALAFGGVTAPGTGLPVNELAATGIVLIALARVPTVTRRASWFTGLLVALVLLLGVTSYAHDLTPVRRMLHLGLYLLLATSIASGRIHLPSGARGAAFGLVAAVGASLAGFASAGYEGRLSGAIGDPNGGGYILVVLGSVALGYLDSRRLRLMLFVVLPVAIVLTYSRTTLLAMTFALLWLVVGRRFGILAGLGFGGLAVYVVGHVPPQLRLFGPFADRTGSDALRDRIITQEHRDIALSPIWGSGAGTANVRIGDDAFFYHSSYLALQREGGIAAMVIFAALVVLALRASLRRPPQLRNLWLESALVGVMICAVNLGEVLLELPAAIALGALVHHVLSQPDADGAGP